MRGCLIKRSKDSYSIKISLGKDATTGKYKYQWVTVKGTKKDAEKRLSEMLNQLDNGTFMKPTKTTLGEYLEKWLADYAKPKLSPRSFERYRGIVTQHFTPEMGNITLTQLKPEHLQRHYTTMLNKGLSARTVRYHHAVIHKALQTAVKWGLLSHNVADAADPPGTRRKMQTWSGNGSGNDGCMQTWEEDEVARFLEAAEAGPYYALFFTALFTGMRRSELLALTWQDIDFLFSQVYVNRSLHHLKDDSYVFTDPKSARSRRVIKLSPASILTLKEHYEKQKLERDMLGITIKDTDLVFCHLDGKPLRPNTVTNAWRFLCSKAGVKPIRLHDARHTHASLLLKQGVHPKVVQERLGHASIQMTIDLYSHVSPTIQEAAALNFDRIVFPRREKEVAKND